MQNLSEKPISDEELLVEIKNREWWQGSVIPKNDLLKTDYHQPDFWVIISQSCNLYNSCFTKVPVFEIVAASKIDKCDPQKIRGDNPRILHVEVESNFGNENLSLELDIQKRFWVSRRLLGRLPKSGIRIQNAIVDSSPYHSKNQWLDKLIGWITRSYTRAALPDEFNHAMTKSKIASVLEKKLTKYSDELYGIFLLIESAANPPWNGSNIGEMPPPYQLSITLVTEQNSDPEEFKEKLTKLLFEADKGCNPICELAKTHNIFIQKIGIDAKNIAELTLLDIQPLIRYTFVDYLSDSSISKET